MLSFKLTTCRVEEADYGGGTIAYRVEVPTVLGRCLRLIARAVTGLPRATTLDPRAETRLFL